MQPVEDSLDFIPDGIVVKERSSKTYMVFLYSRVNAEKHDEVVMMKKLVVMIIGLINILVAVVVAMETEDDDDEDKFALSCKLMLLSLIHI